MHALQARGGTEMKRRGMLALAIISISLWAGSAVAQQAADVEGVKAASQAFYAAVMVLDDGTAMESVWARKPYITYVGPQSKSVILGWDAQKQYWDDFNKRFLQRTVSLVDSHIHVNGNLAWEIGVETGQARLVDGSIRTVDWIATNVYEKIDGRWFMVSHHVQPRPQ